MDLGSGVGGSPEHYGFDAGAREGDSGKSVGTKKHSRKNSIVTIVILVVVLVGVVLIVWWGNSRAMKDFFVYTGPDGEKYNIQKVQSENQLLYRILLDYDGKVVSYVMRNSPYDVEGVEYDSGVVGAMNKPKGIRMLYVTRDYNLSAMTNSDSVIAASEFIRMLGKEDYGLYKLNVVNLFTDFDYGGTMPMISCSNVTADDSVIYLKLGEKNRVYSLRNGCVVVEGVDGAGLIKSADRFAYHLMGVM